MLPGPPSYNLFLRTAVLTSAYVSVSRGVRRSGVKIGQLSNESLIDCVTGRGEGRDREEDAEVERFLQLYCENLGLNLPPAQLHALRAQVRQIVREQGEGGSDSDDSS